MSLEVIVVYKNPSDFPGKFVARSQRALANGTIQAAVEPLIVADTLEAVQLTIQRTRPGLIRLPRYPHDDVAIYETWI